ncbi:DUF5696 domain-containing protein [Paenibacillus sp. MER TA 81-3]|uniref:DUF5696 domain-containing protein n=1 Tax=Paenibacillus sp. MER TA 81-3 TaxID=2939573 RepID=UPI00203F3F11|nr:DUF5696 domain-containing protein [Paenibacillus sp. MER TA 81-3]
MEEPLLRQQSIAYVQEALDTAAQQRHVMLQGGNAYTLPYAAQLTRVPLSSNQFNLTDDSVPFYAMVIHGLLPYAGEAFNSMEEQDVNLRLLQALETGSNVFFSWMESNTEALRETEFDGFYANRYEEWLDEAADAYKQVNEIYRNGKSGPLISCNISG